MKPVILTWALRIIAALILLQTLFFKFSGSEESIYIFSKVGIEPWGRIATGIAELIAALLILIPRTTAFGALMGMGIMAGAIATHLFLLGIEVKNDGGLLFVYALLTFASCAVLVWMNRFAILKTFKLQH
jgi:uncharacterized membrane protein YphA (DoxX/SURF4 family)